ncbi:MAG: hypothetical protein Q8R82_01170 [Hyphomonadaceae bacterium]|nr:hypothetical protein [Hyphomonadaceae bacterium]
MSDTFGVRSADTSSSEVAEGWRRFTDALATAGAAVYARENIGRDVAQQAEITESMVYALIAGLMAFANADRDHPEFTPILNSGIRRFATNADTVYLHALINGAGRYRIVGRRGTVGILHFQVFAGNMGVSEISAQCELVAPPTAPGENGEFEILLSDERPKGYDGLWLQLDPTFAEQFIAVRYVAKDWATEIDPQIAIEPLHHSIRKVRDNPTGLLDRLQLVPAYVQGVTEELMTIMRSQLEKSGAPNDVYDVTQTFPNIAGQAYTHGLIEIGPNEAWIAECEVPQGLSYWGIQLMDFAYNTLEFPFRQCAINSDLGTVDRDGKLRIVVCNQDPGVVNWLDNNGYGKVQIRCRWFGSAHPTIRTKVVPLAEVRDHLPADTETISPHEREARLRKRSIGAQMRRRW